jgi:hypothetical protein
MNFGKTAEGVSFVSESEVLVMIVILVGDGTEKSNLERHKIE